MKTRLQYPPCLIPGHQTQPLSRICTDSQCQSRTLICCICQQLSHKSHKTIPLKTFLQKINNEVQPTVLLQQDRRYQNQIFKYDQDREDETIGLFRLVRSTRTDVFPENRTTGDKFDQYRYNYICQLLGNPLQYVSQSFTSSSQPQRLSKSSLSYFSHLMPFVNFEQKYPFNLKSQLFTIVNSCEQKQKKLQSSIDLIKVQIDKNISKILMSLNQTHVLIKKQPEFKWSETLKGHKVKIMEMIAEQTNMESSGQRFALIEPGLAEYGRRKQSWGIKIKKFVGWVGLGICLRNPIKTANYHFIYTNIGHGSYLISSNGYSWSHSVKQFNSAFKTFQFAVNDIVYVEYDPQNWVLRFRKNQTNDKFQLTIVPPPNDDQYHPCVNLCSTGDSVEIVVAPSGIFG